MHASSRTQYAKKRGKNTAAVSGVRVRMEVEVHQPSAIMQQANVAGRHRIDERAEKPMGIDWSRIEQDYVTGTYTYVELAEKYGVHKSTIAAHGSRGDWPEKRDAYREQTTNETVTKSREKISEDCRCRKDQFRYDYAAA